MNKLNAAATMNAKNVAKASEKALEVIKKKLVVKEQQQVKAIQDKAQAALSASTAAATALSKKLAQDKKERLEAQKKN